MSDGKYDPGVDSTPALAKKAAEAGRVMLDVSDSACLCGCRTPTPGRFRPGHDARLKGKLARAAIARIGVTILNDGKERQMTARAFAKEVSTDSYDWTEALDRAVERAREKKAPVSQAVKEAVKDPGKAKSKTAEKEPPPEVPDELAEQEAEKSEPVKV